MVLKMVLTMESTLTIILITVLLYLLYLYSKRNFDYWEILGVKFNKPLPLVGNTGNQFFPKQCFAFFHRDLYNQYPQEKFVGYYEFSTPALILRDPETIRSIIIKDFMYFHDRNVHMDGDLNPLNNHLAFLKGQHWKIIRSKLSTVFTTRKLKIMFEQLNECIDELCKVFENSAHNRSKPEIELKGSVKKFILDITGSCIFGLQLDCLKDPNSEFLKRSENAFTFSTRVLISSILNSIHHTLPKLLHFKDRSKDDEDFFINFVKESIRIREVHHIRRNDFLQLLIDLRNEESNEESKEVCEPTSEKSSGNQISLLDDSVLAANVFIFLNAGVDTTGTAICLCLLELAVNLDIQDKLYKDIKHTLDIKDNNVSYYDIKNLRYLDWVTSETLRKYPVSGSFPRVCTKSYKMPNTDIIIKEGVLVYIPNYAIHHDPKYYPDPEKFDPERFSEEAKNSRPHCTYLPFGEGPRHCIAMRLALIEMKATLFKVVSQFEFRVCDKTKYPVEYDKRSMMVVASDDIWLNVYRRNT